MQIQNKNMKQNITTKIIFTLSITVFALALYLPKSALALGASDTVPINTDSDEHITYLYEKAKTLDRASVKTARELLHTMSESIVKWTNKGFKTSGDSEYGNSAYLYQPEKFFKSEADNVTKSFIKSDLNSLCEPFGTDIKNDLQKDQGNSVTELAMKYDCTLGNTIGTDGSTEDNTLDEFLAGDFSKGGWDEFMSLATEPQNNPTMAYLNAQSDLNAKIAENEDKINTDLNRGSGFRSNVECEQEGETFYFDEYWDDQTFADMERLEADPDIVSEVNSDETGIVYKRCAPKTPSALVVGAAIQQLGIGSQELLAVQDTNTALLDQVAVKFAERVTTQSYERAQVKSATASRPSASTPASTPSSTNSDTLVDSTVNVNRDINTGANQANALTTKSAYTQSVSSLNTAKTSLLAAKICYENQSINNDNSNWYNRSQERTQALNTINNGLNQINPQMTSMQSKLTQVSNIYSQLQSFMAQTTTVNTNTVDQLVNTSSSNIQYYLNNLQVTARDVANSQSDLTNSLNMSNQLNSTAQNLLNQCQR